MTSRELHALLVGVGVLVFGFIALLIFFTLGVRSPGPGLFNYYSSLYGDAIVLPIWAFALYRAAPWEDLTHSVRKWSVTVGSIAMAGGVLSQAGWILSDNTSLNWTIPTLHSFNAAGWYHAVFLSLSCGLFGTLFTAYILNRGLHTQRPDWGTQAFASSGGSIFLTLLAADNAITGWKPLIAIAALPLLIAMILGLRSRVFRIGISAGVMGTILVSALAISLMHSSDVTFSVWQIISLLALVGVIGHFRFAAKRSFALLEVLIATLPVVCLLIVSPQPVVTLAGVLGIGAAFVSAWIVLCVAEWAEPGPPAADREAQVRRIILYPWILAIWPLLLVLARFTSFTGNASDIQDLILSLAPAVGIFILSLEFVGITKAEVMHDLISKRKEAWRTYSAGVFFMIAVVCGWAGVLDASQADAGLLNDYRLRWIAILGALLIFGASKYGHTPRHDIARGVIVSLMVVGAFGVYLAGRIDEDRIFGAVVACVWAAWVSIIYANFIVNGLKENCFYLRLHVLTAKQTRMISRVELLIFLTSVFTLTFGFEFHSIGAYFVAFILMVLVLVLLVYRVGVLLVGHNAVHYVATSPLDGIRQDVLLISVELFFVGWVPLAVWNTVVPARTVWVVVALLACGLTGFLWITNNNLKHSGSDRVAVEPELRPNNLSQNERDAVVKALRKHTVYQNHMATVMAGPIGLALLLVSGFGKFMNRSDEHSPGPT